MKTCSICSLNFSEIAFPKGCPNQWRPYKANFRKDSLMEFTSEWHKAAGDKIKKFNQ
jgi:hypothetical protein